MLSFVCQLIFLIVVKISGSRWMLVISLSVILSVLCKYESVVSMASEVVFLHHGQKSLRSIE